MVYLANSMEKILSELKDAFDAVSPYIQKHTSAICPSCSKVCCINKHGNYEKKDIIFINALGIDYTEYASDIKDTDPCRFLSEKGCTLPRYKRPFRCTWYFCERLLESMQKDRPKDYRHFISLLQDLQNARQNLLETASKFSV